MISSRPLKDILRTGEDSFHEFKERLDPPHSQHFAAEMVAFANAEGGTIVLGVKDKDCTVVGIDKAQWEATKQQVSDIAKEQIEPPLYPTLDAQSHDDKLLLLVRIESSLNKPHMTSDGVYWMRSGMSKRRLGPQALERLFQSHARLNLDETQTTALISEHLDRVVFHAFIEHHQGTTVSALGQSEAQLLSNMNLARGEYFTLAGLLLFAKHPQTITPDCLIRAVSFHGQTIDDDRYRSRADLTGNVEQIFLGTMTFLRNNLHQVPATQGFNAQPTLEIDEAALQEAVVNALLHRNYGKKAVIRLLVFTDRVEVISPGCLPNHLTEEQIRYGNSVIRNPSLVSRAAKILPYSGLGSGVQRMVKHHPATCFRNDQTGEQFTVTFPRPEPGCLST